jgi:RNA polymerase sigma-70 factor (ECF subfamily)
VYATGYPKTYSAKDDWVKMDAAATMSYLDTSATVELYKGMVHAIALTHTGNRSDAEDVFQNVFLAYHRKQPAFASEERRKAWLIVTTLNCAKQANTSSWKQKVVPLRDDYESHCGLDGTDGLDGSSGYDGSGGSYGHGGGGSGCSGYDGANGSGGSGDGWGSLGSQPAEDSFHFRSEQQDLIFRALQDIATKYRTVLHLFYFEDQSIAQISALLGIEPGTVKVQLSRGRDMMRERLKGEYFND